MPGSAQAQDDDQPYTAPLVLELSVPGITKPVTVTLKLGVTLPPVSAESQKPATLTITATQPMITFGTLKIVSLPPAKQGRKINTSNSFPTPVPTINVTQLPRPKPIHSIAATVIHDAKIYLDPRPDPPLPGPVYRQSETIHLIRRTEDGRWYQVDTGFWIEAADVQVSGAESLPSIDGLHEPPAWLPLNWHEGQITLEYPPQLTVTERTPDYLQLDQASPFGTQITVDIFRGEEPAQLGGSETVFRGLKLLAASSVAVDYRFVAQGELDTERRALYLAATMDSADLDATLGAVYVMTVVGDNLVEIHYIRLGSLDIVSEALPILTRLVDSLESQ